MFRKTLTSAAAAAALVGALAAASPAAAYTCSASAVSGTVLGQTVEPVVAGGASGCENDSATLSALPAPLAGLAGAHTQLVGPADDPREQKAGSMASVENLQVGALRSLPLDLPEVQIPAGLGALEVPLPASLSLLGLPSKITVDALPAVEALVPVRSLPDVPLAAVRSLRSVVGAQCLDGLPNLAGQALVDGLRGLGEDLPVDQATERVVTLLDELTIPLSRADVGKIVLPGGLSFDNPLTGAALRTAVEGVLGALPPVVVPGLDGTVKITPAEQIRTDGAIEQRALRMTISAAGQQVADLVMGIARVATDALSCGRAAVAPQVLGAHGIAEEAPSQAPVPPGIAPATQLAVSCMDSRVGLINIRDKGDHVWVIGAADKRLVGRKVRIVSAWNGRTVKTTWVRESGYFKTRAPMPREGIRFSNDTRYVAKVAGEVSNALKLHREMRWTKIEKTGRRVTLHGRIFAPLDKGEPINIRQYVNCDERKIVAKAHPRPDGTFTVTVTAPKNMNAVSYLAYTEVFNDMRHKKFPTFTLQGYVSL